MLRLYVDHLWTSPYAYSVFVALREKALEFEVTELALPRREHERPDYVALSLTARVPALVHDELALSESSAIVEYLDDTFPERPVLPRDLRQRARARQVMAWVRSDLAALREDYPTSSVVYAPTGKPLSPAGELAKAKLLRVAGALIPTGGGDLFGAWSIADADLAMMLMRLIANGHQLPPDVHAHATRQWQRPSIRSWLDHPRPPRP